MLDKIDASLRHLQPLFPSHFIIVEKPPADKPWPTYDEDSLEDVLNFQKRQKFEPQVVRLYELEHKNRSEVIEAMLRQEDPEGAERQFGPVEENITVES